MEHTARTELANYLRSIRQVPVAASARAAAMRECARERWESRNGRRVERNQVFRFSAHRMFFVLPDTTLTARRQYVTVSVVYSFWRTWSL